MKIARTEGTRYGPREMVHPDDTFQNRRAPGRRSIDKRALLAVLTAIRDIVGIMHRVGFLAADDRTIEQEHMVFVVPFVACDPGRDDEVVVEHELAETGQFIMLPILYASGEFLYSYRVLCST